MTRLQSSFAVLLPICFLCPVGVFAGSLTGSTTLGLAAAMLAAAAWYKPEWVLICLIALSPFSRSPNYTLLPPETIAHAKTFAGLLLGVIWGLRRMLSHEENRFPPWLMAFLSVWLGLMTLTSLHAVHPLIALEYIAEAAGGIVFFWITFHLDKKWHRKILTVLFVMGVAIACLAVLQYLFLVYNLFPSLGPHIVGSGAETSHQLTGIYPEELRQRAAGTTQHPNQLGGYLSFLVPFACAFLIVKSLPRHTRWISVGVMVLLFAGLHATNSRNAFLVVAVSLLYLSLHYKYRWLIGVGLGGFLAGVLFYNLAPNPQAIEEHFVKIARLSSATSTQKFDTFSGRTTVWKNALELAKLTPLLGVGPGNFPYETVQHFGYFSTSNESEMWEQMITFQKVGDVIYKQFHAHNLYLQLVGEMGIFSLLFYLVGLTAVFVHCERRGRSLPVNSLYRAIALATASCAAGMVVFGFFDSHVFFTAASLNLTAGPMLAIGLRA